MQRKGWTERRGAEEISGSARGVTAVRMDTQLFPPHDVGTISTPEQTRVPQTPQPRRTRHIVKKIALAVLLALALVPAASIAQVVIRIGPPPPVVERRSPPPERGFVWIDGYHRY